MKKVLLVLAVILAAAIPVQASEWAIAYGNASNEIAIDVIVDGDNYVLFGDISNRGDFVLKIDSNGNVVWGTELPYYSLFGEPYHLGKDIWKTSDGYISAAAGRSGIHLHKINESSLEKDIDRIIYFPDKHIHMVDASVAVLSDGNYFIVARTVSNRIWMGKMDSDGNLLSRKYYQSNVAEINEVYPTSDGGAVIVGGYNITIGNIEVEYPMLIKVDLSSGISIEIAKYYKYGMYMPNPTFLCRAFESVRETSDGKFITTVRCYDPSQDPMATMALIDTQGNTEWVNAYPEDNGEESMLYSAIEDNGNFVATGYVGSGTDKRVEMIKVDGSGNLIKAKSFKASGGYDEGRAIVKTTSYLIAGVTYLPNSNKDALLMKVDDELCISGCSYSGDVDASTLSLVPFGSDDVSYQYEQIPIDIFYRVVYSGPNINPTQTVLCRYPLQQQPIPEFSEIGLVMALASIALMVRWRVKRR